MYIDPTWSLEHIIDLASIQIYAIWKYFKTVSNFYSSKVNILHSNTLFAESVACLKVTKAFPLLPES